MAQTFPDSPEVIYNTLVGDATFMSYIGTYTFLGGATDTAISIQTPGRDMPELKEITGVECVIHDTSDIRRMDFYNSRNIEQTWKMFLICWEPALGSELNNAAVRAMEIFGGAETIETVATSDGLGAMVQTLVRIPSEMPILI